MLYRNRLEKTKEYNMNEEVPLYQVFYINYNNGKMKINMEHNKHIKYFKKIKDELEYLKTVSYMTRDFVERNVLREIVTDLSYLFKEASYDYEQEMGIIYSYSKISNDFKHTKGTYPFLYINPNFSLQIKEIILAPKFENVAMKILYIQEEVEKMCYHNKTKIPSISISNINFR